MTSTRGEFSHRRSATDFEQHLPILRAILHGRFTDVREERRLIVKVWETFLDHEMAIENLEAWLIITTVRLATERREALDAHRSPEQSSASRSVHLPPPTMELAPVSPADRVTTETSVALALLTTLQSLPPAARTAFILHCVYGFRTREVARALGRSPAQCRVLIALARRRARARRPRGDWGLAEHHHAVSSLGTALRCGDPATVIGLLDDGVVAISDSASRIRASSTRVAGAENCSAYLFDLIDDATLQTAFEVYPVNSWPGLLLFRGQRLVAVLAVAVVNGQIVELEVVRNQNRLRSVARHLAEAGVTPR